MSRSLFCRGYASSNKFVRSIDIFSEMFRYLRIWILKVLAFLLIFVFVSFCRVEQKSPFIPLADLRLCSSTTFWLLMHLWTFILHPMAIFHFFLILRLEQPTRLWAPHRTLESHISPQAPRLLLLPYSLFLLVLIWSTAIILDISSSTVSNAFSHFVSRGNFFFVSRNSYYNGEK